MKNTISYLLVSCLTWTLVQAQACMEVKITDPVVHSILAEYGSLCVKQNFFKEGIGVIQMLDFIDSTKHRQIHLRALVDDRYKEFVPQRYAYIFNYLVFIYDGDKEGHPKSIRQTPELIACIDSISAGLLYTRPKQTLNNTFEVIDTKTGKLKKVKRQPAMYGGNQWNEVYYIFDTPTQYHVVRPL